MQKIKQFIEIISTNIKVLIGFEIIFKLLTMLIAVPLFLSIFDLIMKITGYTYLTLENIISFVTQPITFLSLLILIIIMTVYTMFDITTVIIILDQSYQKKKVRILDAVKLSIQKCRGLFHIRSLSLAFFTLFLIPFLNIGMTSGLISTIPIPEFIQEYIIKDPILFPLALGVVILLTILLFHWIYSLHYFVLEDISFKEARKRSRHLGKKKHLKDFLFLIVIQIIISIVYILFVMVGILLIIIISSILNRFIFLNNILFLIVGIFIIISAAILMVLAIPISYACISVLYYIHKKECKEKIYSLEIKKTNQTIKEKPHLHSITYLAIIIMLILGTRFIYELYQGKYNFNIEYVKTAEVTAHRGASVNYPENTMSAFMGAKELGADWIELDVQQTKDRKIIVIHDTNFKRTTGVDKNTWELVYDDVCKLDAGSFFSSDFLGEQIPLLSDVIVFAKENNIKLNIELKPTGYETDFEKNVVDMIIELDFEDKCVITSQVYHVLENVKAYNQKVQTVYVMSLAYGNITSLEAADHFSIEATSITADLVSRVHREGKELYAWTVNTQESIRKMIELNVDNIITDNISLAKKTIYEEKNSDFINEYIKLLEQIF